MTRSKKPPAGAREPLVLFSSSYGNFPRFFWVFVVPFLMLVSAVLLIRAVWFGEGIVVGTTRLPPTVLTFGLCPLLWGLCGLLIGAEIYRLRRPLQILVTTWGVTLPNDRWSTETVSIPWIDLEVSVEMTNLTGWHVYEILCHDLTKHVSVKITSMLFRDFDDFATFLRIMAYHAGQEWVIKGFWPGSIRGRAIPESLLKQIRVEND